MHNILMLGQQKLQLKTSTCIHIVMTGSWDGEAEGHFNNIMMYRCMQH